MLVGCGLQVTRFGSLIGRWSFLRVIFVCCVIAKLKKIDVLVGIVVEENTRASLALEVNAVQFFAWHLHDLDLN